MKAFLKIILIMLVQITQLFLSETVFCQTVIGRKLTDDQWTSDIDSLVLYMMKTHPDMYWKTPKEVFEKEVLSIKTSIHELTDNQIIARLSKLVSLVKDGHTMFMGTNISNKYFPVRIEAFNDGYFITAVSKKYNQLYGSRVMTIGNFSSAEAFNKIGTLTSSDNKYSKLYWTSRNLTMNSLLIGLGIISSPDILTLEIVDKGNRLRKISIEAEKYPFKDDEFHKWFWYFNAVPDSNYINLLTETMADPPQCLKNFEKPYWFEYIEEHNAIYFCFNSCENSSSEPFSDFIEKLWKEVETKKPEKLIIDLRNNLGGTSDYLQPLIHGIICHNEIKQKGHLFVIIGRKTFSAALHCATWIERNSQPIFVGEPTGAAPNHYADPNIFTLPNSKLLLLVSTTYWQNGSPWDKREWIEPEIKVEMASKDYFRGEDKALEFLLNSSQNKN